MYRAEGVGGELRCGYKVAARLGRWTLHALNGEALGNGHRRITASLLDRDSFLMTQRPLDLVLTLGALRLRWNGVLLDGDTIHVTGQPEEARWQGKAHS